MKRERPLTERRAYERYQVSYQLNSKRTRGGTNTQNRIKRFLKKTVIDLFFSAILDLTAYFQTSIEGVNFLQEKKRVRT